MLSTVRSKIIRRDFSSTKDLVVNAFAAFFPSTKYQQRIRHHPYQPYSFLPTIQVATISLHAGRYSFAGSLSSFPQTGSYAKNQVCICNARSMSLYSGRHLWIFVNRVPGSQYSNSALSAYATRRSNIETACIYYTRRTASKGVAQTKKVLFSVFPTWFLTESLELTCPKVWPLCFWR